MGGGECEREKEREVERKRERKKARMRARVRQKAERCSRARPKWSTPAPPSPRAPRRVSAFCSRRPCFCTVTRLLWWGSAPSPTATEEPILPASSKSSRAKCKHAKGTDAQETLADKLEQNLIFLEEPVFVDESSYSGERIVVFCPTEMLHVARESIEGEVLYRPKVLPC